MSTKNSLFEGEKQVKTINETQGKFCTPKKDEIQPKKPKSKLTKKLKNSQENCSQKTFTLKLDIPTSVLSSLSSQLAEASSKMTKTTQKSDSQNSPKNGPPYKKNINKEKDPLLECLRQPKEALLIPKAAYNQLLSEVTSDVKREFFRSSETKNRRKLKRINRKKVKERLTRSTKLSKEGAKTDCSEDGGLSGLDDGEGSRLKLHLLDPELAGADIESGYGGRDCIEKLQREVERLEEELQSRLRELEGCRARVEELEKNSKNSKERLSEGLEQARKTGSELENTILSLRKEIQLISEKCENLKKSKTRLVLEVEASAKSKQRLQTEVIQPLERELEAKNLLLRNNEIKVSETSKLIQCLHKTIKSLSGGKMMLCRLKPPNSGKKISIKKTFFLDCQIEVMDTATPFEELAHQKKSFFSDRGQNQAQKKYLYDKVFDWKCSQKKVFLSLKTTLMSSLDGEHACIFAYGQTGSGKTYTIMGAPPPPNTDKNAPIEMWEGAGIVPRAVEYLFEATNPNNSQNRNSEKKSKSDKEKGFKIGLSCLEIYNETLRDLLEPENSRNLKICQLPDKSTKVLNLTQKPIRSLEDALTYIQTSNSNRKVTKTNKSDSSSRSHSIYRLELIRPSKPSKTASQSSQGSKGHSRCHGVLSIVDLAGSERHNSKMAGMSSQELKQVQTEANYINKSLTTLGRLLRGGRCPGCSERMVGVRESKLTRILIDALSKGGESVMISCVCCEEENLAETKGVLSLTGKAVQEG